MNRKPLIPDFENSVFEGYAVNFVQKNFWRVQHLCGGEMEDAVSEAKLVFYACRRLYGARVNSLSHFMSLYKRMLYTWFADWSNEDSNDRQMLERCEKEPTCSPEASLTVLLSEASQELKQVLNIIISAPEDVAKVLRADLDGAVGGIDKFFLRAAQFAGVRSEKTPALQNELLHLLS
jgi:hypothetical protein